MRLSDAAGASLIKKCLLAEREGICKQVTASCEGKRHYPAPRMEKQGGKMTKSTTRNRKNNNHTKDEKIAKALKIKGSAA